MQALFEFLQIVSAVKRGKFVKVNTIDPFTGSNLKKNVEYHQKKLEKKNRRKVKVL